MSKQRAVRILSFPWCYSNSSGFSGGSDSKDSACNVGDLSSIPGLGRSPGEGKGYPLHYSGRENSMDCIFHGVAESDTTERLSLHSNSSTRSGLAKRLVRAKTNF